MTNSMTFNPLSPSTQNQTPLAIYQAKIGFELIEDPAQAQAVLALDKLYQQIIGRTDAQPLKGLYLWGDVGRGKTFLMDLFFDALPQQGKLRLHFHRFMARVHQALKEHAGQRDPLKLIAKNLAKECKVLCFDEFFVSDIGDAMILAGLFETLFAQGVVLVATSNIPIERLYENGLARHRFLPYIAQLLAHTQMLHLNGEQDHRLHALNHEPSAEAIAAISKNIGLTGTLDFDGIFTTLTQGANTVQTRTLRVCQRDIPVVRATAEGHLPSAAWFDFYALCDGPRSQLDYIEIASRFKIVMLSGVPKLGGEVKSWIRARGTEDGTGANQAATTGERQLSYAANDDPARRFISLIDELYDQDVSLYLSCDVPLMDLYQGGALSFEFRRTYSRLIEMSHSTKQS
ncbi:cell division protein ZapE [Shewanella xiamenensis]|uniref:cell division protein ZapE n=1 Tax=Shewanella xiamenensis TaxID=332186 RepID=UPI00166CB1DF|nr:cell division protein ZapE [Shewanella xiamenensis]MCL1070284.1 AFG1 family ATPase [Shewanella xiamenensis]MCR4534774.1 cell division protein ZapE [Shewanella xiamenensis]WHF54920.1 cell division protein ZapE [Shewanella xiamenensis]